MDLTQLLIFYVFIAILDLSNSFNRLIKMSPMGCFTLFVTSGFCCAARAALPLLELSAGGHIRVLPYLSPVKFTSTLNDEIVSKSYIF